MSIDAQRLEYLDGLQLDALRKQARDLLPRLANAKARVAGTKQLIRDLAEREGLAEAKLTLSDAFKELKNDPSRKAWLAIQRSEDAEFARAIAARERAQRELEVSEVSVDVLSEESRTARDEIRLAAAQLAFLAEGGQ